MSFLIKTTTMSMSFKAGTAKNIVLIRANGFVNLLQKKKAVKDDK